jgi:Na+/H+-dicarboxylate symporter
VLDKSPFSFALTILSHLAMMPTEKASPETGTPDAFALIISINWFMDRFMTLVNVSGDAFSVGIMARWDNMVRAKLKGDLSSTSSKAVSEDAAKKNSVSV